MKCNLLRTGSFTLATTIILCTFAHKELKAQGAGNMLTKANIEAALNAAYDQFKNIKEGKNADYIPELAKVDPNIFGIALVMTDGTVYSKGDIDTKVAIESVSKVFVMASVIEDQGDQAVEDKIGTDATGLPFNSVIAVEYHHGKNINPLVNPGAIASASLIRGNDSTTKWKNIVQIESDFAGTPLSVNWPVYVSEASSNQHNQAIARLLQSYDRMYFDPLQATDIYTKQCSLNVNAKDLAVMAATLANGGLNPVTRKKVVSPRTSMCTLAVMATAGLYENTGTWLYHAGLPAKSGVGGGLLAVCPGKFGIAVVSPPLDEAGNSVKAQKVIQFVVEKLGVNPYLVNPK